MTVQPAGQTYTIGELADLAIRESSYLHIKEVSGKFKQETYLYKIAGEGDGVLLDTTTAGFIRQFLAKVAPETREKLLSLPITTLVSLMYKHIR